MGPLQGVKIIDLTTVLMGPFATQMLGDFGADVIKIESPGGDVMRNVGPMRSEAMGPLFLNANRSKRSLALNLKHPQGRGLLLDLCRDADILVYNVRPAAMKRLGLSWEELNALNPRMIYAGLYGYGQQGRYAARPAYDDLIQGGSTLAHLFQLSSGGAPRYVPSAIADRVVGLTAASTILAAYVERLRSGRGQRVDVPMFETMVNFILSDHLGGLSFRPPLDGGGYARQLSADRRPLQTSDGHVCALLYTDDHWHRFLRLMGEERRMQDDPRYATFQARMAHVAEVYGWLSGIFQQKSSAEWIELLDANDIPVMEMHTFETILRDPHLRDIGFFQEVEHPTEGPILAMRNPVMLSETPAESSRPAPRLGEHSREILAELGCDDARIKALVALGVTAYPGSGSPPG